MNLFPNDATAQHGQQLLQPRDAVLAEFKAGKLEREGATMRADLRKGVVRVERTEDQLTHFIWRERTSTEAEIDVIVFPAEAKLAKMPSPRCYALRFEGQTGRDLYFWMQEGKGDQDDSLVAAVNAALGAADEEEAAQQHSLLASLSAGRSTDATPAAVSRPVAATPMSAVAPTPASEASAPPSAPPAAPHKAMQEARTPGPAATPAGRVAMGDLQSILSGMGMPQPAGTPGAPSTAAVAAAALAQALMSAGAGRGGGADGGATLSDVLTPDVLMPALAAEGVQERLAQYLPESHRNSTALAELIASPQFASQLQTFSRALQSGQIDLAQFGLRAAAGTSIADFLQEIENSAGATGQPPPPPSDDMQQ